MRKYPKFKKLSITQKEYIIQRFNESGAMTIAGCLDLFKKDFIQDLEINKVFEIYGNMSEMQAKINAGKTMLIYKKPKAMPDFMRLLQKKTD